MIYNLKSYKELIEGSENKAILLNDSKHMEVSAFHVKTGGTLSIKFNEGEDFKRDITVVYIILKGKVEIIEEKDSKIVSANEVFVLHPKHNYIISIKEESDIICITNDGGGDFDNEHYELLDIIKEAEENDVYVKGHNYRVSRYSIMIMQLLDPSDDNDIMRLASGFHDIGKSRLDPVILNKTGKLTDEEFEHIKMHPVYSYEILKEHIGEKVARIARCHHEKLDGSGYPDHLKGDEIPIQSQVIAIADIFDALTTARSYRDALSFEKALEIIHEDVRRNRLNKEAYEALKTLIERKTIVEGHDNTLRKG